jgi:threonine/homoserine/homoserine lactone efflux protein
VIVLVVVILLLPLFLDIFFLNAYDAKRENEKDNKEEKEKVKEIKREGASMTNARPSFSLFWLVFFHSTTHNLHLLHMLST